MEIGEYVTLHVLYIQCHNYDQRRDLDLHYSELNSRITNNLSKADKICKVSVSLEVLMML